MNRISSARPVRDSLLDQLRVLQDSGLMHVEVAWRDHHLWPSFIRRLRDSCPNLVIGAASVVEQTALDVLADLDLSYAMSPCWDPVLLQIRRISGGFFLCRGCSAQRR